MTLDGEVAVLAENLGGTSYGRPYGGGSFSVARNGAFALNQSRPDLPGEVAVGMRGEETRRITSLNEDLLSGKILGEVEEIWWDSSFDGRPVHGWIAKPPDFDPGRRYPLILEIHGGPISSYGDRFSAEVQLLAAAGYVVLYANPRGSTSYGEEFGDLLYRNYPGNDYDDLMSGVDAVIARGYVDEDNLFVTGGSAGGIMTAWIVGKTDRFRAAVAQKARGQLDQQDAHRRQLVRLLLQPLRGSPLGEPGALLEVLPDFTCRKRDDADTDRYWGSGSAYPPVGVLPVVPRPEISRHRHGGGPAARCVPQHEPPPEPVDGEDRQHRGLVRQVPHIPDHELSDADRGAAPPLRDRPTSGRHSPPKAGGVASGQSIGWRATAERRPPAGIARRSRVKGA